MTNKIKHIQSKRQGQRRMKKKNNNNDDLVINAVSLYLM